MRTLRCTTGRSTKTSPENITLHYPGDFQTPGTSFHEPSSHSDTSPSAASQLATIASNLLRSSLQPSSLPVYQRYVSQMLKGFHKVGFRLDGRLPITLPILDQLLLVAPYLVGSPYQVCQFQAMCSLAFYAFLRLGEITGYKGGSSSSPLQISQFTKLVNSSQELIAFKVTFKQYKHSYNDRPFSIVVSR